MDNRFTCAFILRKSRNKSKTGSDVYVRITVNGKRSVMSINRKVDPYKWNKIAGRALGKSEECDGLNEFMDSIRNKFNKIHRQLKEDEKLISASRMIREFNSGGKPTRMVLDVFKEHNDRCDQLIDKDMSKSTAKRYWTCYGHLKQFINEGLKEGDYRFKDVDYSFVKKFEHFLKTVRNCNHNSALKYVNNFKKIVRIAIANKWLEEDPFFNYKVQFEEVEREYLTQDEIKTLWEKDLHFDRLIMVRDMFIFSCYTGLAYSDVKKLSKADITIGIDGKQWINIRRKKTNTRSSIPLLPIAKEILNRYAYHPTVLRSEKLIPVFSNQKSNAFLKEIASICGITKSLTTHLARHTFATTVTLTNGVPIESVSKMLGHKSLRTTQHYAKIIDRKVSEDMKLLELKLNLQNKIKMDIN